MSLVSDDFGSPRPLRMRMSSPVAWSGLSRRVVAAVMLTMLSPALLLAIEPGEPIDYKPLAFFPKRWEEHGIDTRLYPWQGEQVVFLTPTKDLDGDVMQRFIERLDGGWKCYAEIIGRAPRNRRNLRGKAPIAAVPDGRLTCGVGCGMIGHVGIEVCAFSPHDYEMVAGNRDAFPHYYFYEMGRNYFVFGDRHSEFTTGFAVFMRYVCMDVLACDDPDADTRKTIEAAEALYADSPMPFLEAFTMQGGLGEKAPRLKDARGRAIHPSDQPVLFASAMLKLRRDCGGDDFLKRFYRELLTCPETRPVDAKSALRQALYWQVAASRAAERDLSPVFVDRWRLPLSQRTRDALAAIDWKKDGQSAGDILKDLPIAFEGIE